MQDSAVDIYQRDRLPLRAEQPSQTLIWRRCRERTSRLPATDTETELETLREIREHAAGRDTSGIEPTELYIPTAPKTAASSSLP